MDKQTDAMTQQNDVTEDRIPDLMKIGQIPTSYGQQLYTDVIDPVTFNQNRVRFTLQRVSGFLHSNSKVTLGVVPLTNDKAYYPVHIGVANLIKSATLLVGNKTICAIEDFSEYHAYQSMFISNENNKERELYLSQRCMNHGTQYTNFINSSTAAPNNAGPKIFLDVGRNASVNASGVASYELLPHMFNDGSSTQTIADAPVYSVYLSDLFPFLKTNQLPAFMINEEIHIDIEFQPKTTTLSGALQTKRLCVDQGDDDTVEYSINEDEVKLVYDSIVYDGNIMAQYAEQNPRLVFQYEDYRLAKRTGTQTAFTNLTFSVGGNGRLVSKVFFGLQDHSDFVAKSLLGGSKAVAPDTAETLTVNLLYNDRYLFSVDRSNPAQLFQTTAHAEGQIPMIARDEWIEAPVDVLTADTLQGHEQNGTIDGLAANFRWTALRLNRGERINNKGIDLIYKNSNPAASTYTLRVWLEMLKVAVIERGEMSCYFA